MDTLSAPRDTTASGADIRPGSLAAWSVAMRPRTWWIATVPVLVGSSFAFAESGAFDPAVALAALLASIVIQAICNLQNDVGYTARGFESASRIGLPRATARGWLSPAQVRVAIAMLTLAAVLLGLPLVHRGGWPVVAMGVASLIAAVSYMGGPKPIAFTPFGELTVLLFFGVIAVTGSTYVQIGYVPPAAWLGALAIGLHAAAVLAVNNHRDIAHDRAGGRRTFAVTFGEHASRRAYALLVALPFLLAIAAASAAGSPWLALPLFALPRAIVLVRDFRAGASGPAYNALLLRTVMFEVAFGMLLAAGAILTGLRR